MRTAMLVQGIHAADPGRQAYRYIVNHNLCAAAVTLCALHFLSCGLGLAIMRGSGVMQLSDKTVPLKGEPLNVSSDSLF